jgi:copper chaperone CopZ
MTTHTLTIEGMSCAHCVKTVEEALRRVPGVLRADVGIGRATVETSDTTTREELIGALADADYTSH